MEIVRLLDQMMLLGWITRWSQDDVASRRLIAWTTLGRERIAALRETLDALQMNHDAARLTALSLIVRDQAGDHWQQTGSDLL